MPIVEVTTVVLVVPLRIVGYLSSRRRPPSRELSQPTLKVRYADVAWEMAPLVTAGRRDPEIARIANRCVFSGAVACAPARPVRQGRGGDALLELAILIRTSREPRRRGLP
jgi:hypothetical protein